MSNVRDSACIPEWTWKNHQVLGWSPKSSVSEATRPKAADEVESVFYQLRASFLLASTKGFPGTSELQHTWSLWQEHMAKQIKSGYDWVQRPKIML